jgi:uncharacterized membrane protein YesL
MTHGRPESARHAAGPKRIRAADVLRPTFKRFFWHTYDHLGTLIGANVLWLVVCLGVVTAPAATAGLFYLARRIAAEEDAHISDFWAGFRRDFVPSFKLGAFTLAVAALFWFNADFYGRLRGGLAFGGTALATLLVWSGAFLVLMHAHLHPLLAGGERSLRKLLRKSALLVLDNTGFTVGITLQALVIAAFCLITGLGLLFILASLHATLMATGHRELMKKYFPDSPASRQADETRTLRDLWRPWDSQKPD